MATGGLQERAGVRWELQGELNFSGGRRDRNQGKRAWRWHVGDGEGGKPRADGAFGTRDPEFQQKGRDSQSLKF